jgi:hypothetical protein
VTGTNKPLPKTRSAIRLAKDVGLYGKVVRLNDHNPYSLSADGWHVQSDEVLARYDRDGPAFDTASGLQSLARSQRHLAELALQEPMRINVPAMHAWLLAHPRLPAASSFFQPPTPAAVRGSMVEMCRLLVPGADGAPTPLYAHFEALRVDAATSELVFELMAHIRFGYETRIGDDGDRAYDDINWRHACAEVAQVATFCARGLDGEALEDALIASLLSDAAKLRGNFLYHHVDGAMAGCLLLPRLRRVVLPLARVVGICQAVLEHQIGPPRFMADMVRRGITSSLRHEAAAQQAVVARIHAKLADPLHPAHVKRHAHGFACVVFEEDERALLQRVGLDGWFVPHPHTPWFAASTAVIDADSLVNYVSPEGVGKIVAICGPDTPFADETVFHSVFSCGASYVDALSVMSERALDVVGDGVEQTKRAIDNVRSVVARQLARGYLAFGVNEWPRIAREDSIHGVLAVRRIGEVMVVGIPRNPEGLVEFWDAPLRADSSAQSVAAAKLIRRQVADLLRSAT